MGQVCGFPRTGRLRIRRPWLRGLINPQGRCIMGGWVAGSTTGAGLCAPFLGVEFYRQCAPGRSRLLRVWDKWPPETTGATSMRPFCFANRFAGLRPHRGLSCFTDPDPRPCRGPRAPALPVRYVRRHLRIRRPSSRTDSSRSCCSYALTFLIISSTVSRRRWSAAISFSITLMA